MKYIYTMTTQDGTQVNLTMNDLTFAHNLFYYTMILFIIAIFFL